MKLIWRARPTTATSSVVGTNASSLSPSVAGSNINLTEKPRLPVTPEPGATEKESVPSPPPPPRKRGFWSWKLSEKKSLPPKSDVENATSAPQARPIRLFAPAYNGIGAALSLCEQYDVRLFVLLSLCFTFNRRLHWEWRGNASIRVAIRSKLLAIRTTRIGPFPILCWFSKCFQANLCGNV